MQRLPKSFYTRNTHVVAKELLGKLLVRKWRNKVYIVRICEVESYIGENDRASHASKGKTKRTEPMYLSGGRAYVYLIYGMYNCFNIVTDEKDFPAAVLIRGAVPVNFDSALKLNGPGKLCRALSITRKYTNENLVTSRRLYLAEDGFQVPKDSIVTTPRINVGYAGKDALLPWRYLLRDYSK